LPASAGASFALEPLVNVTTGNAIESFPRDTKALKETNRKATCRDICALKLISCSEYPSLDSGRTRTCGGGLGGQIRARVTGSAAASVWVANELVGGMAGMRRHRAAGRTDRVADQPGVIWRGYKTAGMLAIGGASQQHHSSITSQQHHSIITAVSHFLLQLHKQMLLRVRLIVSAHVPAPVLQCPVLMKSLTSSIREYQPCRFQPASEPRRPVRIGRPRRQNSRRWEDLWKFESKLRQVTCVCPTLLTLKLRSHVFVFTLRFGFPRVNSNVDSSRTVLTDFTIEEVGSIHSPTNLLNLRIPASPFSAQPPNTSLAVFSASEQAVSSAPAELRRSDVSFSQARTPAEPQAVRRLVEILD
jgi:hypothetical protein